MYDLHAITPASSLTPTTAPNALAMAHLRLLQALQSSLEPQALVALFFQYVQPILPITGVTYRKDDQAQHLGRQTIHQCDYNLSLNDAALGNVQIARTERWTAPDLMALEDLLRYLVHPLHNAYLHQQALALARIDGLTQVGNRTAFDDALTRAFESAQRHKAPLSLIMLDIDYFKCINDTHGHSMGDRVLKDLAATISAACRTGDSTFRYGGEEFAIILHNTTRTGAQAFAERLRQAIKRLKWSSPAGSLHLTVSMGITEISNTTATPLALLDKADQKLYAAKRTGRNRIECCSDARKPEQQK